MRPAARQPQPQPDSARRRAAESAPAAPTVKPSPLAEYRTDRRVLGRLLRHIHIHLKGDYLRGKCPRPGHSGAIGAGKVIQNRRGQWVLHCYGHPQPLRSPELIYASRIAGFDMAEERLAGRERRAQRAMWYARWLIEVGEFALPGPVPTRVDEVRKWLRRRSGLDRREWDSTLKVYSGAVLAISISYYVFGYREGSTFAVEFGAPWCGVSGKTFGKQMKRLIRAGFLWRVGKSAHGLPAYVYQLPGVWAKQGKWTKAKEREWAMERKQRKQQKRAGEKEPRPGLKVEFERLQRNHPYEDANNPSEAYLKKVKQLVDKYPDETL